MTTVKNRAARPLVMRCGAFGDMVMVSTLLRLLSARFESPVDLVSSGAWTAPLLRNEPALGHLQLLTSRKTPYPLCPSQWALVRWLRARGRGPVYVADIEPASRALLDRAGVHPDDIVARTAADDALPRPWPDRWLELGMRDCARAYPTASVAAAEFRLPRLVVSGDARIEMERWRSARGLAGPLVLFQPGNKRTHKRGRIATQGHCKHWPPQRWAEVAAAIHATAPDAQVLLCGSAPEHAVLEDIRIACGGDRRVHNLAGDLPIPRLLALMEIALGMVSVDTGPAHAAAALGCPLVVLFGDAPPAVWHPLGPGPIALLGGGRGSESRVADVDAAAVAAAWDRLALRRDAPQDLRSRA
ncbi:MAG: glycosyltransferase family 9 protein [Pseudomonadota bacterium]|nr:glycosyltransferase family 9 protein [Pseudomonadota bacterium]